VSITQLVQTWNGLPADDLGKYRVPVIGAEATVMN